MLMNVTNFIFADKKSVQWFILMPDGHLGPYSLEHLKYLSEKGKINERTKIWSEGLREPVELEFALKDSGPKSVQESPTVQVQEIVPPPVPSESIETPPDLPHIIQEKKKPAIFKKNWPIKILFIGSILPLFFYFFKIKSEHFELRRAPVALNVLTSWVR